MKREDKVVYQWIVVAVEDHQRGRGRLGKSTSKVGKKEPTGHGIREEEAAGYSWWQSQVEAARRREKATEVDDGCSCRGKEDEVVERGMGRLRAVANGKNWVESLGFEWER